MLQGIFPIYIEVEAGAGPSDPERTSCSCDTLAETENALWTVTAAILPLGTDALARTAALVRLDEDRLLEAGAAALKRLSRACERRAEDSMAIFLGGRRKERGTCRITERGKSFQAVQHVTTTPAEG